MKKEDFITESFEHAEQKWPQTEGVTRIGNNICERGRKWSNLNLEQITVLFGDIIKDSPAPIDYLDMHLTFVSKNETDSFFDVELKSYIRGFPMPNNYPSPMFKAFVEAFAESCDDKLNEQTLRLEVHRDGFFWDIPLSYELPDEGFYETHFT